MANKLKESFSEHTLEFVQKIRFEDVEAEKKFVEATEIVYKEGRPVNVTGITSTEMYLKIGDNSYPISFNENIRDMTIETYKRNEIIEVDTSKFGLQKISFDRYYINGDMILETRKDMCYYIKFIFKKNESINFFYNISPNKADSIEEVARELCIANAFIHKLIKPDIKEGISDEEIKIQALMDSSDYASDIFYKLWKVQKMLGIELDPRAEKNWDERYDDIEELYLLLVKKRILRLNAKLTCNENTGVIINNSLHEPIIGKSIDITFLSQYEYELGGQKFLIYSASLLTNAIVVDIEEKEDGKIRIIYEDNDSNPMFISNSAFVTEEEALLEINNIMNHVKDYKSAKLLEDYLQEFYSDEAANAM